MKILAATNNKNKIREIKEILSPLGIEIISLNEAGISSDPEETGTTFEENALLKARTLASLTDLPVLADDSGLETDALEGAPGVYSARYAPGSDSDRVNKLLLDMKPHENRNARFVCAVALIYPNGEEICVHGTCEGLITDRPMGDGGFGYDPIFYVPGFKKTYAELSADEKNSISHRGMALRLLRDKITE